MEPDKGPLTVTQMQKNVYLLVKNAVNKASKLYTEAKCNLADAKIRLEDTEEDDPTMAVTQRVFDLAKSQCEQCKGDLDCWNQTLDYVVLTELGMGPGKISHPVVSNGSGI